MKTQVNIDEETKTKIIDLYNHFLLFSFCISIVSTNKKCDIHTGCHFLLSCNNWSRRTSFWSSSCSFSCEERLWWNSIKSFDNYRLYSYYFQPQERSGNIGFTFCVYNCLFQKIIFDSY